jgi:hypothetical protein
MKLTKSATLVASFVVMMILQGCPPPPLPPSASFPIAGGKVWRDTVATVEIKGIGAFRVQIVNGQVSITPPVGLNSLRWGITSKHQEQKSSAEQTLQKKNKQLMAAASGDRDRDGVPDECDWCPDDPGEAPRGCPPGVDGVPPIRWVPLMRLSEGGDELAIEYGIEGCEGQ